MSLPAHRGALRPESGEASIGTTETCACTEPTRLEPLSLLPCKGLQLLSAPPALLPFWGLEALVLVPVLKPERAAALLPLVCGPVAAGSLVPSHSTRTTLYTDHAKAAVAE